MLFYVFLRKLEKGKTLLCVIVFNVQLHCSYWREEWSIWFRWKL